MSKKHFVLGLVLTFFFGISSIAFSAEPDPEAGMTKEQKIARMKQEAGNVKKSTVKPKPKKNTKVFLKATKKIQKAEQIFKKKVSTKK